MDKNIGPNSNRFKEMNDELAEEKVVSEDSDSPENIEEEIKKEEKLAKEQFRARIVKMSGLIIAVIIIIILLGFIISLFSKKNYTYAETEDVLKEAAELYFTDNVKKLPATTSQKVEIHDSVLSEAKYMDTLDKYLGVDTCSGKVIVQKTGTKAYSYTAYLDCGTTYQTTELYKKVLDKKNIVTDGYGLYQYNGGYVYRGTDVNNYVKFQDTDVIWRILKINSSNQITLVQDEPTTNSFQWDSRYNNSLEDNSGINVYKNSFVSTVIDKIYNNKLNDESDSDYAYYDEEPKMFTKQIRSKLLKFNSCVGKRSTTDTSKDGTPECSEIVETKVGLLPVYDFLNASLDPNCSSTLSPNCQNYNYLTSSGGYWLANGSTTDSSKVYSGGKYVVEYNADDEQNLKLVVRIGPDMMIETGKGTKKNPYIIR